MPLTLFTTPKAFTGQFDHIQRNTLTSWRALRPTPEIIVFGDEPGAAEAAAEVDAKHVPDIQRSAEGTPLISAMFEAAQVLGSNAVMCFANADIILFNDLYAAVDAVERQPKPYLITGRRQNVDVSDRIDFSDQAQLSDFAKLARERGELYYPTGMDYFVFRRGTLTGLPDLAVGRARWDNFMLYYARKHHYLLIDATNAIFAVHQNHDYSHHAGGQAAVYSGVEAKRNLEAAGGWAHIFTLNAVTHTLDADGLHPASRQMPIGERLTVYSALHPWAGPPIDGLRWFRRALRRLPRAGAN